MWMFRDGIQATGDRGGSYVAVADMRAKRGAFAVFGSKRGSSSRTASLRKGGWR